ncbi:MAG: dihydropteroate synthase [Phycisphaerae bacterium]|nr:dihydropteroate synthase [Phycisphaerae bacterium]
MARSRSLALDRPRLVAILNATPDSFYEGSRLTDPGAIAAAAERAVAEGADMLDIGGESTRPGAGAVSEAEQIRRVVPGIEAIRALQSPAGSVPISVDTTRSEVARRALEAGADAINDVSAGTDDPRILALAAATGAGLVLMHRLVAPAQDNYSDRYETPPAYADVVAEVRGYLSNRASEARAAGVGTDAIAIDPGLGFGKSVEQNVELIRRTGELAALGFPVVSAASRKSFVGRVSLGRDSMPEERLPGSLAMTVLHLAAGARLFRVHDVAPHAAALRSALALGVGRPVR